MEQMWMLKMTFHKEEWYYFQIHSQTPLHHASIRGHLEIVKCLIENGAELNVIWDSRVLYNPTTFFISISNFIDPYFQVISEYSDEINWERLIENGMIWFEI